MSSHLPIAVALLAAAALVPGAAPAPRAPEAPGPVLRVPPRAPVRDTTTRFSEPAPLLIPGRPSPGDTVRESRAARALDHMKQAMELERKGELQQAVIEYRTALLFDPELRDAHHRMGRIFLRVNQLDAAQAEFAAEVEHHPDHLAAARDLGWTLARNGDAKRAITQLELLTRRVPRDGESWHALGFAYMGAHRPKDAEAAIRRAIALGPPEASEYRDLGTVLAALDRPGEARTAFRRAIRLDPSDGSAWVNLGNLERRAKRDREALADYREAQRRDSTLSLAYQGEIGVLTDQDRRDEAVGVYRRWLRVRPDDYRARLAVVRLLDDLGRPEDALRLAADGVRHAPRSGDARLILGMCLDSHGRAREALHELRLSQRLFHTATEREKVRRLIATLRFNAPDSLREFYRADSIANERPGPVVPVPPARAPSGGGR